jgi:colicin import membrane protein
MKKAFVENFLAGSYSLLLHLALVVLLIVGLESTSTPQLASDPSVEIVQATVLDEVMAR